MGEGGLGCTASVPPAGQAPLTPPPRTPRGEAAEGPPPDHAPRSGERRRRDSGGPPGGLPWPGLRSSRARGPVRAGRRQNGRLFLASVPSGKSLKVPPEAPPPPRPSRGRPESAQRAPRGAAQARRGLAGSSRPPEGHCFVDVQSPSSLPLFRGVLRTHPNLPSSTEAPSMSQPPRPAPAHRGSPPPRPAPPPVPAGVGGAGPAPRGARGGEGAPPRGGCAQSISAGRSLRPAPAARLGQGQGRQAQGRLPPRSVPASPGAAAAAAAATAADPVAPVEPRPRPRCALAPALPGMAAWPAGPLGPGRHAASAASRGCYGRGLGSPHVA